MSDFQLYCPPTERDQRIRNVVNDIATKFDRDYAKSVVAISGSESGFVWSTPPLDPIEAVLPCDSPTTVIGVEPKGGDYANMYLASNPTNPGAIAEAVKLGLIAPSSTPDALLYRATGAKVGNSKGQHQLFQVAMKWRDKGLARSFSLGPTQMYLIYSAALGGSDPARGSDWEDLWRLYHMWRPSVIMERLAYTKHPPYPSPSADSATAIHFLKLSCQAGCTEEAATKYYSSHYAGNLGIVLNATK